MPNDWPTLPSQPTEAEKAIFTAQLELVKAAARQDELDLDEETAKKLYAELLSLASQSIERARKSAELVQAAAVAVGGLYTGVLGFIFVAKDNPMPWRGIWPTVFLGLAVVLAMSYSFESRALARDFLDRRLGVRRSIHAVSGGLPGLGRRR